MRTAAFTGGGILDGDRLAVGDQIDHIIAVDHDDASHHYALIDGTFAFTGHGQTGELMSEIISGEQRAADAERAAIEAARQPRGCRKCGRTYADLAAYQVAHDPNWPGCVPPDVAGLVEVDGVFCRVGSAGR